jgi:hypothetical protein
MRSWFTKVRNADIPADTRVRFETLGVAVVAQILARDQESRAPKQYVSGFESHAPVLPADADHAHAVAWLKEQNDKAERRQQISESVEITILILVGIEALPVACAVIVWVWHCIAANQFVPLTFGCK